MQIYKKLSALEYVTYTAIIAGGIFLDQLTKFLAFKFMTVGQSIPLIEGFLHITYTTNDGAAFGAMDNMRWLFISVSIITILLMGAYLYLGHAQSKLYAISMSMIVSGGIGNMIDRLGFGFYKNAEGVGEVIDFIDFCGIWKAIFNGADSFVCVGAGLLVLAMIIDVRNEAKKQKNG